MIWTIESNRTVETPYRIVSEAHIWVIELLVTKEKWWTVRKYAGGQLPGKERYLDRYINMRGDNE